LAGNPGVDSGTSFGTFVLSSDLFIEKFLLPKLSCISRVMDTDILEVTAHAWEEWLIIYYQISSRWGVGQGDQTKDATDFKLQKSTKLSLDNDWQQDMKDWVKPLVDSPGEGCNVWSYRNIEGATLESTPTISPWVSTLTTGVTTFVSPGSILSLIVTRLSTKVESGRRFHTRWILQSAAMSMEISLQKSDGALHSL
jgi:hypothetical protein